MAIYHLQTRVISRSKGQSAIAAAAYRHATKMLDEYHDKVVSYEKKQNVVYTHICIPDNSPAWLKQLASHQTANQNAIAEMLWNKVELTEKRTDSQLAREIIVALPLELHFEQHKALLHDFIQHEITSHGIVADLAIHHERNNPHAHIMMTMRTLTSEGFGSKERAWNQKSLLESWRKQWAEYTNSHLAKQGIHARIDHRSYEEQGIDLIPTIHEGKKIADMNKRGIMTNRLRRNNRIRKINLRRIQKKPDRLFTKIAAAQPQFTLDSVAHELGRYVNDKGCYAPTFNVNDVAEPSLVSDEKQRTDVITTDTIALMLKELEQKHNVISEHDIARIANTYTEHAVDFQKAVCAIKASPALIALGAGDDGRNRYTTQKHVSTETALIDQAYELTQRNTHVILPSKVNRVAKPLTLSEQQLDALHYLGQSGDIALLLGRAGTGKSYLMNAARQMWEKAGYRVTGSALAGIAAKGLFESSGIESRTLASLTHAIERGTLTLDNRDILVIDEAGMIDFSIMDKLVNTAHRTGAKLVLIGDDAQLQPIQTGAPFRALIETVGCASLSTIRRQHDSGDRLASEQLSKGHIDLALKHYDEKGCLHMLTSEDEAMQTIVKQWYPNADQSLTTRLMLAFTNKEVRQLNTLAREQLHLHQQLGNDEHIIQTDRGKLPIRTGERIVFLKNDRMLGVNNGEFATVTAIEEGRLHLAKDDGTFILLDPATYQSVDYAYATTVHKAQGVTVDDCYLYLGTTAWDRHLAYVAMTRHRQHLSIVANNATFKNKENLGFYLGCDRFNDNLVDYPLGFGLRRGFEESGLIKRCLKKIGRPGVKILDSWTYITNYERWLKTKTAPLRQRRQQQATQKQREQARVVAEFVDSHRDISQRWDELIKWLEAKKASVDEETHVYMNQHPDFNHLFSDMLEKNALGFRLYKHYKQYQRAFQANRFRPEMLIQSAHRHRLHRRTLRYMSHCQNNSISSNTTPRLRALADWIMFENKASVIPHIIHALADKNTSHEPDKEKDDEWKKLYQQLSGHATQHRHQQLMKKSQNDRIEQANIRLLGQLYRAERRASIFRNKIKQQGGFDNANEQLLTQFNHACEERDRLSHDVTQTLSRFTNYLTFYHLSEKKLGNYAKNYLNRELVKRWQQMVPGLAKQHLACKLVNDKKTFWPYLKTLNIDTKLLYDNYYAYQNRLAMLQRSPEERQRARQIQQYRTYQSLFTHCFKQLKLSQEKQHTQSSERIQARLTAYQLKRNQLAQHILSSEFRWFNRRYSLQPSSKHYYRSAAAYRNKYKQQRKRQLPQAELTTRSRFLPVLPHQRSRQNAKHLMDHYPEWLTNNIKLHAKQSQYFEFAQKWHQENRPVHRHMMASHIVNQIKQYHFALKAIKADYATLYQDAATHRYHRHIHSQAKNDRDTLRLLHQYQQKQAESRSQWRQLEQNSTHKIDKQTSAAIALSHQRNQLAYQLVENHGPSVLKQCAGALDISIQHIETQANHYQYRSRILAYQQANDVAQRDSLAHLILQDKTHYRYVYEKKLSFNVLRTHAAHHTRREIASSLSTDERKRWQMITEYEQACMDSQHAWRLFYEISTKVEDKARAQQQKQRAINLTQTRNQIARKIIVDDIALTLLQKTTIKLEDIQQHAKQKQPAQLSTKITPPNQSQTQPQKHYYCYETIHHALLNMQEEFYDLFIQDKRTEQGNSIRYGNKGSFVYQRNGTHTGMWYSFESATGGGPIQFLMDSEYGLGLSYVDALKEGAKIAGLTEEAASVPLPRREAPLPKTLAQIDETIKQEQAERIKRAQYYVSSSQPITGTLGEKYLREHRHIQGDISQFRYHPCIKNPGTDDYYPGIVLAAKNEAGEVTGCQTILLNPNTAKKADVDVSKRSRGVIKGSSVLIKQGQSNEVILAEGPETAASLILAKPDATIYVTLGNSRNVGHLGWLAKKHNTNRLHFAADNDGQATQGMRAIEKAAQQLMDEHGVTLTVSQPLLNGQAKRDYNDVLMDEGIAAVKAQLADHQTHFSPNYDLKID